MACRLLRLTTVAAAVSLFFGCDQLFGPESRELAGGYRLKRVRGSDDLALIIPHGTGGQIIDEIGWREPLIVARGSGSRYWEVINTTRAEHTRVSDETLKTDPTYKSMTVITADQAWGRLKPDKPLW
jgi:hypothetical protein